MLYIPAVNFQSIISVQFLRGLSLYYIFLWTIYNTFSILFLFNDFLRNHKNTTVFSFFLNLFNRFYKISIRYNQIHVFLFHTTFLISKCTTEKSYYFSLNTLDIIQIDKYYQPRISKFRALHARGWVFESELRPT